MNSYEYKDITVEVFDDPMYKFGSADNIFRYAKHYFGDGAQEYPTSKHGIKLFRDGQEVNSCIVIGSRGATVIHKNAALLDGDELVICCSNTVFCLALPDLELKWETEADPITCFQILKLNDDYIVHGELQVTRLDKDGKIRWYFGGADIFVSIDGEEEFKIETDHILLTDFAKTKYKIDFNGKLIESFNELSRQ